MFVCYVVHLCVCTMKDGVVHFVSSSGDSMWYAHNQHLCICIFIISGTILVHIYTYEHKTQARTYIGTNVQHILYLTFELPHALFQHYHPMTPILLKHSCWLSILKSIYFYTIYVQRPNFTFPSVVSFFLLHSFIYSFICLCARSCLM